MAVIGPPHVDHEGLLVPNASEAASPRMAEPDQIDFATAAHGQWGVVQDCYVSVSGTTAYSIGGLVVIDGELVAIREGEVSLGDGQPQDRFDLIVARRDGVIAKIDGIGATDPVFPDVPRNCTLLAAVFCPTSSGGSYQNNVVDKRRFVSKALLTKIPANAKLIQNANGSTDAYSVLGDGETTWHTDTRARRTAPATLTIEDNLELPGKVTAGGAIQAASLTATGLTTGSNLLNSATMPPPAPIGAIWQNSTSGSISLMTPLGWKKLGFVEDMVPVGTVILSMESFDVMIGKGWLPLDGRWVSESVVPSLFGVPQLVSNCEIQGLAPTRTMRLPDASNQMLRITSDGTSVGKTGGKNKIKLLTEQIPLHKHDVTIAPGGGFTGRGKTDIKGEHSHYTLSDGRHGHDVVDHGHTHEGADFFGNRSAFVCLMWGGGSKLDAEFNDRNHTYSVDAMSTVFRATSNIEVPISLASDHNHSLSWEGWHDHTFNMDPVAAHPHTVTEQSVGGTSEVDITPAFISLHAFVRT